MKSPDGQSDETSLWRLGSIGAVIFAAFLILVLRLGSLQLLNDGDYKTKANTQGRRVVIVPAPRGNIYDRQGRLLVGNRPAYNIVADVAALQGEIATELLHQRKNDRELRRLNESLDGTDVRSNEEREKLDSVRKKRAATLASSIAPATVLQRHLDRVNTILGRHATIDIGALERHLARTRTIPFTLVRDISETELARFVEHVPVDSPMHITTESIRAYPHGTSAAHILGYVRNDRSDTAALPDNAKDDPGMSEFLALGDEARKRRMSKKFNGQLAVSGVEARFDKEVLQGTPGYQVWTVRPNGYAFGDVVTEAPPQQGGHLYLSLDLDLQRATEQALAQRFPEHHAAVVALDIKTGEVLVCANAPSFDPARVTTDRDYRATFEKLAGTGAWFNRATQIAHPPGSSFKPITAIAALRSGVVTPDTIKQCDSYIMIGNKRFIEHDRRAFGEVNLARMLEVSSNVYCYQVGIEMGIDKLAAEAKRFGLDTPSTLEISTARPANLIISTPEHKRKVQHEGWATGDTANAAIGQGFSQTTLLHLTSMFASLARNETRTEVSIIHDPTRTPQHDHHGEPIGLTPEQYQAVIDGLVACASPPRGTGRSVSGHTAGTHRLNGLSVATKTGTAQISRNTANIAWVLAFAPVENPQIAVGVMIEGKPGDTNFGGGTNAGPIANALLYEWQKKRTAAPK
jgi:penicillin-binding protein 2